MENNQVTIPSEDDGSLAFRVLLLGWLGSTQQFKEFNQIINSKRIC